MLVDGKRLMPANGDGVTDLNIIPSSLIESVEIITGGASAVYGSDALAGVVNFKLKRKFDGVEIDGTWGQTERGDGTQYEPGLTAGTNFAEGQAPSSGTWDTPTANSSPTRTAISPGTPWRTTARRARHAWTGQLFPAGWIAQHRGRTRQPDQRHQSD